MASKHKKELVVPPELPGVVKAFMREVLRSQPDNVYEFGSAYFAELLAQYRAANSPDAVPPRLTPDEMEEKLRELFEDADQDGSGFLSLSEFKNILKQNFFGLRSREVKRVMSEADVDGSGSISYAEFLPVGIDLIQGFYARMDAHAAHEDDVELARRAAAAGMRGMGAEDLATMLRTVFAMADKDGSGKLSLSEFSECIRSAELGLTRREINLLMYEVDVDHDGTIAIEEFAPLAYDMITQVLAEELLKEARSHDELAHFIAARLSAYDTLVDTAEGSSGKMKLAQLAGALRKLDLGLTRVQIQSVIADVEGEVDEDGCIDYDAFAPKAAAVISELLQPLVVQEKTDVEALGAES